MLLVEQVLLNLPEHMRSLPYFSGVGVARFLVLSVLPRFGILELF